MSDDSPAEMAHCALINFDNLATMVPGLADHPMFNFARWQLVEALAKLGRDVRADPLHVQVNAEGKP